MAKKVLIVEDGVDIREALKVLIEFEGYEALIAGDGFEGYDQARSHLPDLILMDLAMPRSDGICGTRLIRSDRKTAHIPIVGVTSHAKEFGTQALIAGANEVHSKTSFMDDFTNNLNRYLGDQQQFFDPAVAKSK